MYMYILDKNDYLNREVWTKTEYNTQTTFYDFERLTLWSKDKHYQPDDEEEDTQM